MVDKKLAEFPSIGGVLTQITPKITAFANKTDGLGPKNPQNEP